MSSKKSNQPKTPPADSGIAPAHVGNPIYEFFASKAVRETIESVAIAFVLAFLFRTFEAEAFVIPTGSMAQTLMGAHKDVICQQCGYQHTAGASEGNVQTYGKIVGTTCPMCRYVNRFPEDDPNHRTYTGDRILVSKFVYDFQEPERWDVIVFKCPYNEKNNYIKRLVGLPNQTTRIKHGNIWAKGVKDDESKFVIARKPPEKILAMLQEVHDTNYIPLILEAKGWPRRWQPTPEGSWTQENASAKRGQNEVALPTFTTEGGAQGQPAWLRYRHVVPNALDWNAMQQGALPADRHPPAQLITDFYSYNAGISNNHYNPRGTYPDPYRQAGYSSPEPWGLHWVGDLAVEAEVNIKSVAGTILLDLVRAGRHYRCAIDVATGKATLSIVGIEGIPGKFSEDDGSDARPTVTAQTAIRGAGQHRLMLANVDNQLTLWVDGKVIAFDGPTTYLTAGDDVPVWNAEDDGDLAPAGIGSEGAALAVNRLKVFRDIYYIAAQSPETPTGTPLSDYRHGYGDVWRALSDPRGNPGVLLSFMNERLSYDFDLGADQFFTCGDNSPQSQDARIWGDEHFVDREFLIGKALFIYWPHAVGPIYAPNPLDGLRIGPITPNFKEMGFVR